MPLLPSNKWVTARGPAGPPAPFVVGVGRSGTTLLRLMLDAHPQLAIPPETHFLPDVIEAFRSRRRISPERFVELVVESRHRRWGDFGLDPDDLQSRVATIEPLTAGDGLRAFYGLYAERAGKPRWGDKTPNYATRMARIHRALPEARFIHLIRDGRDVALSTIERLERRVERETPPVSKAAGNWSRRVTRSREQGRRLPHYIEVRYEDLVSDTEPALRRVCEFIELAWDPAMLDYHHRAEERLQELARDLPPVHGRPARPGEERLTAHALTTKPPKRDRVERWRQDMSPEDRATFEAVAGGLLAELGYPVGAGAEDPGTGAPVHRS